MPSSPIPSPTPPPTATSTPASSGTSPASVAPGNASVLQAATDLAHHEAIRRARLRVAERITDLVGNTPLVRLRTFDRKTPGVELWAKCEFFNPGGSVKDRAAY